MRVKQVLRAAVPLAVLALAGCAAAPPQFVVQRRTPVLEEAGGTLLVTDTCVRESVLVGNNYFVTSSAGKVARALTRSISEYIADNGVRAAMDLIPFECGAIGKDGGRTWKVAERIGARPMTESAPFAVPAALRSDPKYVRALSELSSYVFVSAMAGAGKSKASGGSLSPVLSRAAALVRAKTHRDCLLYVGFMGNRISGGRKVAENIGRFLIGTATGIATLGLLHGGGTSYGMAMIPGGSSDEWLMVAGLLDLRSGRVIWSGAVHGAGDPTEARRFTGQQDIDLLMKGLFYRPSAEWHPPGVEPR